MIHETLKNGETSNIIVGQLIEFLRSMVNDNSRLNQYFNAQFKKSLKLLLNSKGGWKEIQTYDKNLLMAVFVLGIDWFEKLQEGQTVRSSLGDQ